MMEPEVPMPSEILLALYRHDTLRAAELADAQSSIDVFEAAALGEDERLRTILAADSDAVASWSDDGFSALHFATFFAQTECIVSLLNAGAEIEAVSHNAMSVRPLHSAVASRSVRCVEILVAAGADPNAQQSGGFTPLHAAVHNGDSEIEALLIAHGADPTLRSDDGRSAADFTSDRTGP
jgi:uncharacterized protein